ncbi:uncharacterized protein [Narcine bancroftii]|uniref:uncharacterized protein n=1 Tax=Narcine bancroftii TaxID=1343680 RepID=UPI0038318739
MFKPEDLSEVAVSRSPQSETHQEAGPCKCQRRLVLVMLASGLLLFITVAGLLCAFFFFVYPKITEARIVREKYAAHLLAEHDVNRTIKWFNIAGLGSSYVGSGFRFENQELHSTKDGMYYVYAKLKVICSIVNKCNNSSTVKLELMRCTESTECARILNMEVKMPQDAESAFDQSSTLIYLGAKSWLRAKIDHPAHDSIILDYEHVYFGAFLIGS